MGIQVTYQMKDLLADKEVEINFKAESYTNHNGELTRVWYAFTPSDIYMGMSISDDIYGAYWFDNKTVNMDSREFLDQHQVPYNRC